jgi:transcriptional regulator with XRE-family HTH domain
MMSGTVPFSVEGKALRKIREAVGLGQQEFAEELGVSQQLVSICEAGVRKPSIGFLARIEQALGVAVTEKELRNGVAAGNMKKLRDIGRVRRLDRFDKAIRDEAVPLLKRLCDACGWSQSRLVELSGLHRFAASDAWMGKINLKRADAEKVAGAFGIEVDQLVAGALSRGAVGKLRRRVAKGDIAPKLRSYLLTPEEAAVIEAMRASQGARARIANLVQGLNL